MRRRPCRANRGEGVIIKLSESTVHFVTKVACNRIVENIFKDYSDRAGRDSFDSHIYGFAGEVAVALALDIDPKTLLKTRWGDPDMPDIEVRYSNLGLDLRIKKEDKAKSGIAVTGDFRNGFTILGWIPVDRARRDYPHKIITTYYGTMPGHYVPVEDLHDFEYFAELYKKKATV